MGITGLIGFVNKASRDVNISNFAGYTAAVDVYCWLHRGAFSCAERLVKGEKTDGYVHYCVKMVNVLLAAKVTPILVFDGCNLPSKEVTEVKRRETREKNRNTAKEYLRQGKIKEAREWFQRSIDVTPQMALDVIQVCRDMGIDCIVAPYEADAQLAYLIKTGIAQLVITEDSDLIAYGCERVLLKMDVNGRGVLVEKSRLHLALGTSAEKFTFDKFRYMCIMSGCDYLPSLPGIGLKKAFKFFSAVNNPDLDAVLLKIPQYLNMPKLKVTNEYCEGFHKANNTFLHQLAFDPIERKLTPLYCYPPQITGPHMIPYAGPPIDNDVAFQIAIGNMNVTLMKPMAQYNPDICKTPATKGRCRQSIWDLNYKPQQFPSLASCVSPIEIMKRKPTKNKIAWVDTSAMATKCSKRPRSTADVSEGCTVTDAELISIYEKETASPKRSRVSNGEVEVILETPEKCLIMDEGSSDVVLKQATVNVVVRSRFFAPSMNTDANPPPSSSKVSSDEVNNPLDFQNVLSLYSNKEQVDLEKTPKQNISLYSKTGESNVMDTSLQQTLNVTLESSPSLESDKVASKIKVSPQKDLAKDLPSVISPEPDQPEPHLEVTPKRNHLSSSGSLSKNQKKNQLPNGVLNFDVALSSRNASGDDSKTSKFFSPSPRLGNFAWKDELKKLSATSTPECGASSASRNPFKVTVPSPPQKDSDETPHCQDSSGNVTTPSRTLFTCPLSSNYDSGDEFQDGATKKTLNSSFQRSASTPCGKGRVTPVTPKLRSTPRVSLTRKRQPQKAASQKGDSSNLKQLNLRQTFERFQFKHLGHSSQTAKKS